MSDIIDENSEISNINLDTEMRQSYLDYAMSVIVSRALPDARDGLKPVHRRILYSMYENNYEWNKPYRKSARVVGDVIGKYHPHGDQSIYDALVRMAQPFSMHLPLIEGQGNFGSVDGDPPAAMRYTEVRMEKISQHLLNDLDKETVDFQENYDNSESEPIVIPAEFPNLLVNGAGGIAVGMATNIPPHNLGEITDACLLLLDKPEASIDELIEIVPGPDFPTGGIILGQSGSRSAYSTGKGSIIIRGKVSIEDLPKDKKAIIISEIPYQLNKVSLIEKIAELVREKTIDGITDLRDESDRNGMRIYIELRKDAVPDVILNQLYRYTQLQTSFGANTVALDRGNPKTLNLKELLECFLDFREEVVTRRIKFLLNKARDRAHILVGLAIAVSNIDEIIKLIRSSKSPSDAKEKLMKKEWPAKDVKSLIELIDDPRHSLSKKGLCKFSDEQARAILELRLQRLTAIGKEDIENEMDELKKNIEDYLLTLKSKEKVIDIIKKELTEIKDNFSIPRRTEIVDYIDDVQDEDLIKKEEMAVTVSHSGYIKRVPLSTYRSQNRGGKGRSGMQTKDEDFVTNIFVANTHQPILFFSSTGMVYKLKTYLLPISSPQAKGKALINLLPLSEGEVITTIMPLSENEDDWKDLYVMFATSTGGIRRNNLSDFLRINKNGKIAMKPSEGESIISVQTCTDDNDILLATKKGQCIRFSVDKVRVFASRSSTGVRGIKLDKNDSVMAMSILNHVEGETDEFRAYLKASSIMRRAKDDTEESIADEDVSLELSTERYAELAAKEQVILTVASNGQGKRTSSYEYRLTNRGGKGVISMMLSKSNSDMVSSFPIDENDEIMLIDDNGQLIRCPVSGIRIMGRNTQGVKIFNISEDSSVVSVERVVEHDSEED
jgi:DNA gyrase subunit A|tara:strand:+ start:1371 stop:4055 length:2685 start_codon:yes stop_codon:yes gene_type:complete